MHHVQGHTSLKKKNLWVHTVTKKEKESRKARDRERDFYIRQFFADQSDTVSCMFATLVPTRKQYTENNLVKQLV